MANPGENPVMTPFVDSVGNLLPARQFGISPHLDLRQLALTPDPWWVKPIREKRWLFVGLVNPDFTAGAAVVHLGYLASSFTYIWLRNSNRLIESSMIVPPGPWVAFSRDPVFGTVTFRSLLPQFRYTSANQKHSRLSVHDGVRGKLTIDAELELQTLSDKILQAINPVDDKCWAYTCKIAGIPVSGKLTFDRESLNFNPSTTTAFIDWTDGFHARTTTWKWATGSGATTTGIACSFNFSSEVYDRGPGENVVWLNQQPQLTAAITVKPDPEHPTVWYITTEDQSIDLIFQALGKRHENVDLKLLATKFCQFFGDFSGTIRTSDGACHRLESCPGFFEDHFAVW